MLSVGSAPAPTAVVLQQYHTRAVTRQNRYRQNQVAGGWFKVDKSRIWKDRRRPAWREPQQSNKLYERQRQRTGTPKWKSAQRTHGVPTRPAPPRPSCVLLDTQPSAVGFSRPVSRGPSSHDQTSLSPSTPPRFFRPYPYPSLGLCFYCLTGPPPLPRLRAPPGSSCRRSACCACCCCGWGCSACSGSEYFAGSCLALPPGCGPPFFASPHGAPRPPSIEAGLSPDLGLGEGH